MAIETLFPNGDDGGWPTGSSADIAEGIASADGSVLTTTIKNDVVDIDLDATAISDTDTVNSVTIKIRGRTNGTAIDFFRVDLLIGGVVQGSQQIGADLTASFGTQTFADAAGWDSNWTAAQLNGMQVRVTAGQSGMPADAGHEIDAIDVDVDWTAAAVSAISGSLSVTLTPVGTLNAKGKLSGAASATVTPAATLKGAGALSGQSSLILMPNAGLKGGGSLAGQAPITLTPAAAIKGAGKLAGAATVTLTPSGDLTAVASGDISGAASLALAPAGTLKGAGALAIAASLAIAATGVLQGHGRLAGPATLTLQPSAVLAGQGALAAAPAVTLAPSGDLRGFGTLSGSAAVTFAPSGNLAAASSAAKITEDLALAAIRDDLITFVGVDDRVITLSGEVNLSEPLLGKVRSA